MAFSESGPRALPWARSLSDLPRTATKIEDSAKISLLFRHLFTNKLLKIMKILTRTSNFSLIRGKSDRLLVIAYRLSLPSAFWSIVLFLLSFLLALNAREKLLGRQWQHRSTRWVCLRSNLQPRRKYWCWWYSSRSPICSYCSLLTMRVNSGIHWLLHVVG